MTKEQKELKLAELRELYKKSTNPIDRRIIIIRATLLKKTL